ncbi:MAG: hypothetical protein HY778_02885 [Betaproteobacteria bacterium]|nr:hypothetical protein [Betaproteobacteria bacterium]
MNGPEMPPTSGGRRWRRWRAWICTAAAVGLSGCYGALMIGEPHPKLGTESGALVHAMYALMPELRGDAAGMEASRPYRNAPIKSLEGTVPFGVGHIWVKSGGGGLQCNRSKDPHCLPLIVGHQVYMYPRLLERIESTVRHLCFTIPVPQQAYPGESYARRSDTERLRQWGGCDGAPRERRTIVLYVVRELDALAALDAANRRHIPSSSWPQHVVEKRTFFINE